MSSEDDIRWIELLDDFFWSAFNQGIGIGSTDIGDTYAYKGLKDYPDWVVDGAMYTIIDTGSSAILISQYFFEDIIDRIYEHVGDDEYVVNGGYVYTRCYRNFPKLYFLFDNLWIEVRPEEYVLDTSDAQDRSQCALLIASTDGPMNIFGMPVFHGYYTIHDMENGRLGYVPTDVSAKKPLEEALFGPPVKTLTKKGKSGKITVIITIQTALLAGLVLAYWYGVKVGFDHCFPDKAGWVISLSIIYFALVGIF